MKKNVTNDTTFPYDTQPQSSVIREAFVLPNETEIIKNENSSLRINNTKYLEASVPETLSSTEKHNHNEINDDRYLTEDEIVTISKLLHTVRRSDLDSLIEIYNLAKDIYKEIDAFDPEPEDGTRCDERNSNCSVSPKTLHLTSYWHSPMNSSHGETNTFENDDMQKSSTNQISTLPIAKDTAQHFSNVPDINRVSYYYPMTSFQRYSSYLYDPYAQYRNNNPPVRAADAKGVPCNNTSESNYYAPQVMTPWVNRIVKRPFTVESANKVYGPNLLPYPFSSIYRYNAYPKDIYFDGKMWTQRPVNEMQKQDPKLSYTKPEAPKVQQQPNNYNMPMYYANIPNYSKEANIISHNDDVNGKDNIGISKSYEKPIENIKEKPSWQTDPLPTQVLEEVRANIMEKTTNLLNNKIRKSPKFEKIGKLLRLDKVLRNKRSIDENNAESILDNKIVAEKTQDDDEFEAILDRLL